MKSLKERIIECKLFTENLMRTNPEVSQLWFDLRNCDIEQLNQLANEITDKGRNPYITNPLEGGIRIMAYSSSTITVFAYWEKPKATPAPSSDELDDLYRDGSKPADRYHR